MRIRFFGEEANKEDSWESQESQAILKAICLASKRIGCCCVSEHGKVRFIAFPHNDDTYVTSVRAYQALHPGTVFESAATFKNGESITLLPKESLTLSCYTIFGKKQPNSVRSRYITYAHGALQLARGD